jgi:sugar transferase (PEP-CTERM/EpsH1 system associated)
VTTLTMPQSFGVRVAQRAVARKPTVVQVLLNLGKGGMEAVTINLAHGLTAEGFRCVVIALDAGGENEDALRCSGIEYHVLGGGKYWDVRCHWKLTRLLRDIGADIVHTHHFAPLLRTLPSAMLAGVRRVIHTEHSEDYLRTRLDHRLALRMMSWFTHAFVVVADAMEPFYREEVAIAAARLRVIANGVDTERFHPPADMRALRRAAGLPGGLLIGTAGRFFPEKNFETLVRGAAGALRRNPDAHLVMVGDGPERTHLEQVAQALGIADRVIFAGWRKDIADVIAALDVFVLTSVREGCPLAVLEAMSSGVPVIATPVGDVEKVVLAGRTGLLFPVGDVEALSSALIELLENDVRRHAMGRQARSRILVNYNQRTTIERYAEAYTA